MTARQKLQKAAEMLADTSRERRFEAYNLILEAYDEAPGEFTMIEAALVHTTIKPLVKNIEKGLNLDDFEEAA